MKDKHGHIFADLMNVQRLQLNNWCNRLERDLFLSVHAYCEATNKPAVDETHTHRVYRGQDLVQIIMDWPDLKPGYANPSVETPTVSAINPADAI